MVHAPSMRVAVDYMCPKKPADFEAIEAELLRLRFQGDYAGAGRCQRRLEAMKQIENTRHQQVRRFDEVRFNMLRMKSGLNNRRAIDMVSRGRCLC